jgi:hypothetical protein
MKKVAILSMIPFLLLLSGPAFADDTPAAPAAAVEVAKPAAAKPADAKPAAAVEPVKSDDPVKDAETLIDGETETINNDPGAAVSQLTQLAKEGRWGPFVGLLLMFLIWALRKFIWKLIPKSALPWVTLGAGMVATGAIELGLGVVWWKVLIDSLATSGIAMGFWSLLFKHFMKPKENESKPA